MIIADMGISITYIFILSLIVLFMHMIYLPYQIVSSLQLVTRFSIWQLTQAFG